MSERVDLLIGDAERTAAESELRRHYDAGRLTLEEFEERLGRVHGARTESELGGVFRQLPATKLPTLRPRDTRWRSLAVQYAFVNAVSILVWFASGGHGDFWPKWVLVGTAIMFARRLAGPRGSDPHGVAAAPASAAAPLSGLRAQEQAFTMLTSGDARVDGDAPDTLAVAVRLDVAAAACSSREPG